LIAKLNKAILVTTYNRVKELDLCLKALAACATFSDYYLVIVYHQEQEANNIFISGLNYQYGIYLPVDGSGRKGLENMNRNRITGLNYCFDTLNVESVVAVEDDVVCGYDALTFCSAMIKQYTNDPEFRGVNLGSKEPFHTNYLRDYNLFRFGIFGQGGAVTKPIWRKINKLGLLRHHAARGFDFLVEHYYKTGFVVMPRCSRYIDLGWNGTHAPKDPMDQYYQSLNGSWVGSTSFEVPAYRVKTFSYDWRDDCLPYKKNSNIKFYWRFLVFLIKLKLGRYRN
jgi:hypothetical protein